MSLQEESEENEIIEKYIKSDESIKENIIFVINLQNLLLLILLNRFKEKYQRINSFFLEFVCHGDSNDNNKTFKVRIVLIYSKVLNKIGDESQYIINNIHDCIEKIMGKENIPNNAI